jgi:hypothetical protein
VPGRIYVSQNGSFAPAGEAIMHFPGGPTVPAKGGVGSSARLEINGTTCQCERRCVFEIFIDFGLVEIFVALGIAALAKAVYSRKTLGIIFIIAGIAAPALLVFIVESEEARWLAAAGLATALVNASVVLGSMQRGNIPSLHVPRWQFGHAGKERLKKHSP